MPKAKSTEQNIGPLPQPPPEPAPQPEPEKRNFLDRLEEWADNIVNAIKYDRLKLWKEVFFHPTATYTAQMQPGIPSLKRGAKDVFVASLPGLLIGLVFLFILFAYLFLIGVLATIATLGLGAFVLIGIILGAIVVLVLYFASPIISWFLISVVQYLIAKVLGGKADFTTQAYLVALGNAGSGIVQSFLMVLSYIPCLGWVFQPIATLVSAYGIYLNYKAVKTAHGFSTTRAAIVVLLPIVLIAGLLILIIVGFYVGIFSLAFLSSLRSSSLR